MLEAPSKTENNQINVLLVWVNLLHDRQKLLSNVLGILLPSIAHVLGTIHYIKHNTWSIRITPQHIDQGDLADSSSIPKDGDPT